MARRRSGTIRTKDSQRSAVICVCHTCWMKSQSSEKFRGFAEEVPPNDALSRPKLLDGCFVAPQHIAPLFICPTSVFPIVIYPVVALRQIESGLLRGPARGHLQVFSQDALDSAYRRRSKYAMTQSVSNDSCRHERVGNHLPMYLVHCSGTENLSWATVWSPTFDLTCCCLLYDFLHGSDVSLNNLCNLLRFFTALGECNYSGASTR